MSAEIQAELEARAQVDLTLRSAGGGELEVVCEGRGARVVWRPRTGGSFERTSGPAATPAALVDVLLVAVAELADDAASAGPVAPQPPPHAAEEPRPESGAQKTSDAESDGADRSAAPEPDEDGHWKLPPFGLSAAGRVLFFSSEGGTVGPEVGAVVRLRPGWVAAASIDYGFGFLNTGAAVDIHTLGGSLSTSRWFGQGRMFEIGAGVAAGALVVSASTPYSPDQQSQAYFAWLARARMAASLQRWRISIGPEVRWYTPSLSVHVNQRPVWDIPAISFGLSTEVLWGFDGGMW